jgi:hypothetical protein
MGLVRMGAPNNLIEELTASFKINNFVETGTYHGGTASWAADRFKNVLTIEYSKELYEQAIAKFNVSNIEFIFGDSRTELSKLIERLDSSSLFWLDAHWSGGVTYGDTDQCPLIEEINIINSSSFDNFILIDDARLFTSPPQPPHKIEQWPDIAAVIEALKSKQTDKYIVIIEDVIIAVPSFAKPVVSEYCQNVNAQAWEDYGKQLKTSNLDKAWQLIYQEIKGKLRSIKTITSP